MIVPDPAALRRRYQLAHLDETSAHAGWYEQFGAWFAEAVRTQDGGEANAMQVATVDPAGRPAVRTVLLKGVDTRGVVFFSHGDSAKGRQLRAHPYAAAVLYWPWMERQVRVSGPVERLGEEQTAAYFATRPRGSQLGAWASPQSQVIASRAVLDERLEQVRQRFADVPQIPVPPGWGGFRIVADEVEFWQGRADRLHDRLRYRRADSGWVRERLAP